MIENAHIGVKFQRFEKNGLVDSSISNAGSDLKYILTYIQKQLASHASMSFVFIITIIISIPIVLTFTISWLFSFLFLR